MVVQKLMCYLAGGALDAASQSAHKTTQYEKLTQEPSDEEVEDDVVFIQESAAFHRNGFAASDIRNHIQTADEAVLSGLLQKGSVSSKKPVGTDFIEVKMARLRCGRQLMSKRCAVILCIVLIILIVALISIILSTNRSPHLSKPTSKWVKEYSGYGMQSISVFLCLHVVHCFCLDTIFSTAFLLHQGSVL